MPKSDTVDEFSALMADICKGNPDIVEAVKLAVEVPVAVATPKPAADKADAKKQRDPVAKTTIDFPGCPFESTVADDKGYLNMVFTRSSRAFLYEDKLEQVIRFFQQHGDAYLAAARSAGLRSPGK
jgi:hypothetical protein